MNNTILDPGVQANGDRLKECFQALLPRIQLQAQFSFRHFKCPHRKEEAIAETIALAWLWYCRLATRGKDVNQFPTVLASFAVRAVRRGRRLCGQERANDVLSPMAQRRHQFKVEQESTLSDDCWLQALQDNTQSPVPNQVCFRCDFPRWRSLQSNRDRHLMHDLMVGERTMDVAGKYAISPARVSQLRQEFYADWERFCESPRSHEDGAITVNNTATLLRKQ